ncbi:hypothetical protein [Hyphomonas sp.]|uniref:hypothetical protein n=2 Tax=Hyphomonas sp. TaxID=87 RepID=UPI003264DD05
MMFRLLLLAQIFLFCEPAFAKPITLIEFRDEFLIREFQSVKIGYIDTHPTMSAAVDKQGFEAVLRECSQIDGTCQAARFTACRDLPGYSRLETLELANQMNEGFNPGTAYAKKGRSPSGICVRFHVSFRGEDDFGLRQIFEWQQALEDFIASVDSDLTSRIAADVRALVQP